MLVGRARPAIPVRRVNDVANHSSTRPLVHLTRLLVNLDKMDDSGMEFLSYFCIGMCKEDGAIKKYRSHVCVFENILYICIAARKVRQDIIRKRLAIPQW